jgi:hypothetical protein
MSEQFAEARPAPRRLLVAIAAAATLAAGLGLIGATDARATDGADAQRGDGGTHAPSSGGRECDRKGAGDVAV